MGDLLVLLLYFGTGLAVARALLAKGTLLEQVSLAFPLGIGLTTWMLFLLSWAGVALTQRTALWTTLLLVLSMVVLRRIRNSNPKRSHAPANLDDLIHEPSIVWTITSLALLLTFFVVAYLSVAISYSTWDAAAIWAAKGYGIALERTVFAAETWGAHYLGYPLNIPLAIGAFQLASGDPLPMSKVIFPAFAWSMFLGIFLQWRRDGVNEWIGASGVGLLVATPVVLHHSMIGYANLPTAVYLVLGTVMGIRAIGSNDWPQRLLPGLLLGLAGWTRVEAVLLSICILLALATADVFFHRRVPDLLPLSALLIVAVPWHVFYRIYGAAGTQAENALLAAIRDFSIGDLRLHSFRIVFGYFRRYVLDAGTWGLVFPVSAAVALAGLLTKKWRLEPADLVLALSVAGTAAATVFIFYVGSFNTDDFLGWLIRGFPRAFLPTAALIVVFAFGLHRNGSTSIETPGRKD
jgi:hypothetical protein